MKKALVLVLDDKELLELYRILVDKDAEAALTFLNEHLRKQVIQVIEGG